MKNSICSTSIFRRKTSVICPRWLVDPAFRCTTRLAATLACVSMSAYAVDYTWDGTVNNWNTAHWDAGAGLVTFPAGNSNANAAFINSGVVSFNQNDTFGNAFAASTPVITINAGGTLSSSATPVATQWFNTIINLNLNGGTLLANGGANGTGYGAFALRGTVTVGGSVASNISVGGGTFNTVALGTGSTATTFNVADVTSSAAADLTIATVLNNNGDNNGGLIKAGAGTLVLSAANTFNKDTVVSLGMLTLDNALALQNSALNYSNQGGTISFGTLAAATFGGLGGTQNLALTNATPAAVALSIGNNNNNYTYTGVLSGAGSLTKVGTGAQTLSGANTFTGNLVINKGTLVNSVAANTVTPTATGLGNMTVVGRQIQVNSGATLQFTNNDALGDVVTLQNTSIVVDGGTVDHTNKFVTLSNITLKNGATMTGGNGVFSTFHTFNLLGTVTTAGTSGSLITTTGTTNTGVHLGGNITFDIGAASPLTIAVPLINKVNNSGAGSLTKSNTGTLALTGTNTYTGATTVNAGTLLVSGSIAGSTTTVNATGTLGGSGGTVGAVSVNASGTLAPGASIGRLNTGSVSLAANSTFALEINTGTLETDLAAITGNLSLADADDAQLTISNLGAGVITSGTFTFITYTGLWDGDLFTYAGSVVADGGLINVGANQFTLDYDLGGNSVALLAVPEPNSALHLFGGLGCLIGLQRFRRKSSR